MAKRRKPGQLERGILMYVEERSDGVTVRQIVQHFKMKDAPVARKVLERLVKRGDVGRVEAKDHPTGIITYYPLTAKTAKEPKRYVLRDGFQRAQALKKIPISSVDGDLNTNARKTAEFAKERLAGIVANEMLKQIDAQIEQVDKAITSLQAQREALIALRSKAKAQQDGIHELTRKMAEVGGGAAAGSPSSEFGAE